ncbi:hypothetical protein Zm00014a_004354 [Zea mays]|jgi:hypothetical protein|uniref:Uncharacterized protein n=2 Tax=Zea mays TaxID=4577 RepID=B4FJA6_MAIZE|nr:uncharacterized protein LOC100216696 [Zea mays]XP_008672251.1 uncharacterized protein LOC100216696 isoform X1 [Zea mays]ACF82199.1 unknown [Zea mays]ONM41836.1 hypothetical protein ZEAMMB73_Zm00001d044590 [Zea mays]PWZ33963.1 hypothetical protein Zm00014a_004354 [Zea mays]|eukprot:NP_001136574.1 uncharacterized protein LOC100216696 [Zea mays]
MSRFFRGAALTAAAAVAGLSSAFSRSLISPLPLAASPSSPSTLIAASGHLALVRAHPGLRELDAMLTPASFLVDATQAFLIVALRCPPIFPETIRRSPESLAEQILSAESEGHTAMEEAALKARTIMALMDAREGRLDDALDAIVLLAAERPGDTTLRLYAAALCYVLSRHEEGGQWLQDSAVPDLSRYEHKFHFVEAVLNAAIGSAPRAVVGSEELVLVSTLWLLEMSMWSIFTHGNLRERLLVLAMMAFLRGVVARKLHRDDGPATKQGS